VEIEKVRRRLGVRCRIGSHSHGFHIWVR
jgi:hypothetical protein